MTVIASLRFSFPYPRRGGLVCCRRLRSPYVSTDGDLIDGFVPLYPPPLLVSNCFLIPGRLPIFVLSQMFCCLFAVRPKVTLLPPTEECLSSAIQILCCFRSNFEVLLLARRLLLVVAAILPVIEILYELSAS